MPKLTAEITIGGKLAALRLIASGHNGRMQLAMHRMLEAYARWTVERFETMSAGGAGVDPKDNVARGQWDPLSSNTLGPLVKVRRLLLILVRTGLMREMVRGGFVETSGMSTNGFVHTIRASFASLQYENGQNTLDVMGYHQEGTDRMPQRKIMWDPDGPSIAALAEIGKQVLLSGL